MKYRELIHKMQQKAGFSDAEAEDALDLMVESIAERLPDDELRGFASQLPAELQNIAMNTALEERDYRKIGLVEEFMEKELIEEARAKKQVMTAWEALKSFISEGEINHLKAQLPHAVTAILY